MSIYPTLTIIIPCYNEKNTIIELFDKIENIENISKEIEKQKAKLKESIAKEKQNEEWNKMKHIIYDKEFGKKKRAIKVLRAKRRIPEYMIQIPNSWKDIEEEWERDMEETLKANYFNTK